MLYTSEELEVGEIFNGLIKGNGDVFSLHRDVFGYPNTGGRTLLRCILVLENRDGFIKVLDRGKKIYWVQYHGNSGVRVFYKLT